MDERDREGTAATLRAAGLIVIAGIALGLAFNALSLGSRPPRGLPWIKQRERMPSLEELQPASGLVPALRPGRFAGFALVGTAWAGGTAPAAKPDTARAAVKKPAAPAKASAKATAKTTKAPVQPAKVTTQPVRPAIQKATAAPAAAPPAAKPAPAAAVALPTVPDLDQPIEVKLAFTKRFFDAGPGAAVIVDAREPVEYAAGHIAGAQSLPYEHVIAKLELLDPYRKLGRPVILYCGVGCESSHELGKLMTSEGIRKVLVFTEGFEVWRDAGHPVEKGAAGAKR
jgi:rhodanese-related sulfurtransferase